MEKPFNCFCFVFDAELTLFEPVNSNVRLGKLKHLFLDGNWQLLGRLKLKLSTIFGFTDFFQTPRRPIFLVPWIVCWQFKNTRICFFFNFSILISMLFIYLLETRMRNWIMNMKYETSTKQQPNLIYVTINFTKF